MLQIGASRQQSACPHQTTSRQLCSLVTGEVAHFVISLEQFDGGSQS
jgi:hypothetical protein